jgi:hypothetical protein
LLVGRQWKAVHGKAIPGFGGFMRRIQTLASITALTLLAFSGHPGFAQSVPLPSDAFWERMKNHDDTLQVETKLAGHLNSNDRAGLLKLAAEIKKQDGVDIDIFYRLSQKFDKKDPKVTEMALRLGPCHYAGLTIRAITLSLAERKSKVVREHGIIGIRPGNAESLFVSSINSCEKITRRPVTERKIGSSCAIDGRNCFSDD